MPKKTIRNLASYVPGEFYKRMREFINDYNNKKNPNKKLRIKSFLIIAIDKYLKKRAF